MLIVMGSVNADLVFQVAKLPRPGETVLCPGFTTVPGGKGANQAVAAARAGATVRFFGAVGADSFGQAMRHNLQSAGIDAGGLATVDQATGVAIIGVEAGGENSIMVGSGANLAVRSADVPDAALGPGTTLLCQNEVPRDATLELLARARASGSRTLLNLAPVGGIEATDLAPVDILVVNEHEAASLTGRAAPLEAARALAVGREAAIVTLGGAGVLAASGAELIRVPSLAIRVVDTTGAGDAFVGVLAGTLDAGISLEAAIRRAAVAGGLACERLGAQAGSPTGAAIAGRLAELGPTERV